MKPVIEVKNLSKKYRIGVKQPYYSLRDTVSNFIRNPFTSFKKRKVDKDCLADDEFWALKDISFKVMPGEVIGIIGKNGAGKTTLLKLLSRITPLTEGEIVLRGRVASLLEIGTGFHPELTGRENIFLNGAILGMKQREIKKKFDKIVDFSGVEKFLDTPVKHFSSGMYMRLAFSVAAHLEPEILIVDEVLAVGDSEFQKKSLGKMESISKNKGRTILFVSHNLVSVQKLCERTILLEGGRIKQIGGTKSVIDTYLNSSSIKNIGPVSSLLVNKIGNVGNFRFIEVKISNSKGSGIIRSGDKLKIILKYTSDFNSPITDARIVIPIISESSGQRVLWLDSDVTSCSFSFLKPKGELICETEEINLMEGSYSIEVNFHIQGTSVDYIRRAGTFEVRTSIEDFNYKTCPDKSVCDHLIKFSFKQ